MMLQYRSELKPSKVKFLHNEDFRNPEINSCLILWECRIPLEEDGINEMYIEIKKVEISYCRWLGNPNYEDIKKDEEITIIEFNNPRTRIRFIDKLPIVRIKPVEIYVGFCDEAKEYRINCIEFSK